MKRKFRNQRGESFIETLASMLIICLGMLILAGAIVSSARVNKRAADENIQVVPSLPLPSDTGDTGWFVAVRKNPGNSDNDDTNQLPIALYKAVPEGGGDDGKQVLYYYTP